MTKFLLLYTAPAETRQRMQQATPEEMKEGMQPWMDWFQRVGANMVDKGMPLAHAMTVTQDGVQPGNPEYVGYNVVQAENIDEAIAYAKDNPHMKREGGAVEVHEMMEMPGM
ncbi:MAG TPA: hypothetical protein VN711_02760 [Candidatus Saccharimonadales bacterium]|nr:hypothetical protein [Candidatus Saccharimonadales bacterium]